MATPPNGFQLLMHQQQNSCQWVLADMGKRDERGGSVKREDGNEER